MTWKRSAVFFIFAALLAGAVGGSPQAGEKPSAGAANSTATQARAGFSGDGACSRCHQNESLSYAHTAHHLTSQPATVGTVLGNLHPPGNVLTISDPKKNPSQPALFFKTEIKKTETGGDAIVQSAVTGWGDQLLTRSEQLDVVTGSGVRGQTYLYWQGDQLFELPVSYWGDGHRWVNSPGYIDGTADFSRPVNPGCLECHATYIRPLSSDELTNSYEKQTLVTGISCETCHGPGAEHVARYSNGASHPSGTAILNPAKFSRDRQVDACAYCHNGIQREAITPAFSFVPGRPLTDFFKPLETAEAEHPDVHGNQVGLLQRSRCYQSSPDMSCSTCHDTHAAEKTAASYSSACLKCHQWTSCGESKRLGHPIVKNCIDCHMPVEATNVIVSETAGAEVRAKMRNHWIKVYSLSQNTKTQTR
jgi:Cytochrome c554 and c-prime